MTISLHYSLELNYVLFIIHTFSTYYNNMGLWFRGIMSALHAEGPGFDSLRVHLFVFFCTVCVLYNLFLLLFFKFTLVTVKFATGN